MGKRRNMLSAIQTHRLMVFLEGVAKEGKLPAGSEEMAVRAAKKLKFSVTGANVRKAADDLTLAFSAPRYRKPRKVNGLSNETLRRRIDKLERMVAHVYARWDDGKPLPKDAEV